MLFSVTRSVASRPTFVVDDHPSILACVVLLHIGKSISLRHIEIDVVCASVGTQKVRGNGDVAEEVGK